MKSHLALVASNLVIAVYGHGYLTVPASRTRLGFEVSRSQSVLVCARF
jgi:hypothetical protein